MIISLKIEYLSSILRNCFNTGKDSSPIYGILSVMHPKSMNRNKILQSNLLDIIFDNRNKEYGAYVLRRDYEHRLGKALLTMLAAVIVFAVWLSLRPAPRENFSVPITGSFDPESLNPAKPKEAEQKVQKHTQPATRNTDNAVPVIIKDSLAEKKIKSLLQDSGPASPGDQPPGVAPQAIEHQRGDMGAVLRRTAAFEI